jgi:hypothetical protein
MAKNQWLDISPLIKLAPSVLAGKLELADCFSRLFRLFGSPIPHISSPAGVVFHIPHENSIVPYFSALDADTISNLGVIFFDTRSVVLGHIPETLGDFTFYVVVNRLSKRVLIYVFEISRVGCQSASMALKRLLLFGRKVFHFWDIFGI